MKIGPSYKPIHFILSSCVAALLPCTSALAQIGWLYQPGCTSKTDARATECFKHAWQLNHVSKTRESLAYCNMALARDTKYGAAYLLKGYLLSQLDRLEEAVVELNKGLALLPECPDYQVYSTLGGLQRQLGDDKAALATYSRGIAVDHGSILVVARADLYMKLKQTDKALADCDLAIRRSPNWASGYQVRARIYRQTKQYEKSLADNREWIKREPNDSPAYNDLGLTLKALGRTKEAEAAFAKSNELGGF